MPRTSTPRAGASSRTISAKATKAVSRAPANGRHRALVAELANRFRADLDAPDLPLLVINTMAHTNSAHILVIWEKWKSLTIPERASVIIDAYGEAHPNMAVAVRFPIGLTPGEALTQGYLGYQIIPLVRPTDHVTTKQVNDAMASAGGLLMQIGGDRQLRFATRAQAREAYRRLLQKLNKPIWTLVEEMSSGQSGE